MLGRIRVLLSETGELFAIAGEGFRYTPHVRRWWREWLTQCWFLARVTSLPVLLVSLPLGAVISLQVGELAQQLGAQSATGSAVVLGIVREVAPVATALLISGAGGSAMASDVGARKIRDELAAMETMAVNPVQRLVTARLWAASTVGVMLVSLVVVAGVGGGFFFNVVLQHTTPGAYFEGATSLLQPADLVQSLAKAWVFGFIAAMVSCYKGFKAEGGPSGVGTAVNQAVVLTFLLVFVANYVMTTIYFALVPPKI